MRCKLLLPMLLFAISLCPAVGDADEIIRVGVLSHRGDQEAERMWAPTFEHLNRVLAPRRFQLVPLDFAHIEAAVKWAEVDFLLTNPGIYVDMEVRHRVSRLVTLNQLVGGHRLNQFAGVVFTRSDRDDLASLADLKGQRFLAVDETSLGGYQMAWRELLNHKIDPRRHFSELAFAGTHDQVVMGVLAGDYDAGTVRSNILERMCQDGLLELDEIRVIGSLDNDGFPFLHSTRLYPEWPFSKLRHTSNSLARQVAVALLGMPEPDQPVELGHHVGWTVPLDYQEVHNLFRALHLPPYDQKTRFTLNDALREYWPWILALMVFLAVMLVMSTWVARLNRQLKQAKFHLERQHGLILDSVCDGIYGVDSSGNCTFVNRSMTEITGWQIEDMIGKNQHDILHHTYADGSPHPMRQCPVYLTFRDDKARFVADDVFWKKDGTSIPVEYSATPVKDGQGRTLGSVVVFRDISERKQAEEALRKYQADLAHMARLNTMGEMASGMAHELNQPLTAIATNASAAMRLLESPGNDKERLGDILERIVRQAQRSGEIIRQLRQFVSKEQPERSPVLLSVLVEEVLQLLKNEINRARIKVVRRFDPHLEKILVQPIQIDLVILNLCKNAIEAMNEVQRERVLTVVAQTGKDGTVAVAVQDTGPGVRQELRDALFDPFVTSKTQGMGLGLSISQGIVSAHQGRLFCEDAPGGGAVFRFVLPINGSGSNG